MSIKEFQKRKINIYKYIPYKSAHPRHTIKNYVIGELIRCVLINTENLNFLKIKHRFFLRMRHRGFNKNKNITWPKVFKRFIDDGFGVIKEFLLWVNEFNCLRKNIVKDKWQFGNIVAFTDLHIFKGEKMFTMEEN